MYICMKLEINQVIAYNGKVTTNGLENQKIKSVCLGSLVMMVRVVFSHCVMWWCLQFTQVEVEAEEEGVAGGGAEDGEAPDDSVIQ